jgi:hypothetical protein
MTHRKFLMLSENHDKLNDLKAKKKKKKKKRKMLELEGKI